MHYHSAGIANLTIYTLHNALWKYLFKVNSLISSLKIMSESMENKPNSEKF